MKDEKSKTETQGSPDTKVKTFSEKKEENATPERKVNPEKKRMFMTREDPERLTKLHESGRNRSKHLKTDSEAQPEAS